MLNEKEAMLTLPVLLLYVNAKSKTILDRDAEKGAEESRGVTSAVFELQ